MDKPRTRAECANVPRPCPFMTCRYNNGVYVVGKVVHERPQSAEKSCALDLADRGESTLEEVGNVLGVTRERVRQIETLGLEHLRWRQVVRRLHRDGLPEGKPDREEGCPNTA